MRLFIGLALLALVSAAAGCGGSGETSAIPSSVAAGLAAKSESIAAAIDAGDECGAAKQADDLRHATDEAIANGSIPVDYQRDLQAAVANLQNTVNCPPPPPHENPQGDEGNGEGKAKGHKKHDALTVSTSTATSTGTTTGQGD